MSKRQRNIKYKLGDVFSIPSEHGCFYLGQIAVDTTAEIAAPFCYIFGRRNSKEEHEGVQLTAENIISAGFITPELIHCGVWKILSNGLIRHHDSLKQVGLLRDKGYVGAVITGGGLVADFVDTYFGLKPRSDWPDINYVNRFFLTGLPKQAS